MIWLEGDQAAMADGAISDLLAGLRQYEAWSRFALHEIRQRFRRSVLGPFWLTLSMGTMVAALGLVFGTLFHQDVGNTLPYIAVGLIFWGLLTSCIAEGTTVFMGNAGFIRNVPLPLSFHLYKMVARNLLIWAFNMAIYAIVLLAFSVHLRWDGLLFFPSFVLFVTNLGWMSLLAGILSARFRDIPQVILNLLQVIFLVTPVFWSVEALPGRPAFVLLNPLYHLLEIVRAPLLGRPAPLLSLGVAVAMAIAGSIITLYVYDRVLHRIAYWV